MKKNKIVVCAKCEGDGYHVIRGELMDYHKGIYSESTKEECSKCDGHGRVRRLVTYEKLDG